MTKTRLGYLGIGLMGLPMTRRLLKAGYQVTVWNRSRAKIAPALADGAAEGASPAAVARATDIVFACVTDATAIEAVVFGPDGLASVSDGAKVFVDHSSMRPDLTRDYAKRLAAANGMGWIDAPVSGGVPGAEQGTLAIMAGGEKADFDRVAPVVAHTAERFTLMGPCGAGQTTKLCNQVISGCTFAVIAEAMRLAANAGVDAALLPVALKGGFADSKPFQIFAPRMLQAGLAPLGHNDTLWKDVETALQLGRETRVPMPMTGAAAQVFRMMMARGLAKEEPTILYRLYGPESD